jgi:succinate dehydrogenase/fumarate reductase-like Fe-S protein
MNQNRRSFLARGWKMLAVLPVVAAVAAKTQKAEAGLFRRRCRRGGCSTCG